ncbi:MAG: VCBS repeat-containing protein [SAR324 cluster bacterium]|nr:VCBS repeat-containing protein [SAR324 cluster bacterium]
MQKDFIKLCLFMAFCGFTLLSTACSFKERPSDDEDNTATTTKITITRIDGVIETLKFSAPMEIDQIGSNPLNFVMKDLNNDNREDLVLLNSAVSEEDQAIRVLIRTSVDTSDDPNEFFENLVVLKTGTDQRPQSLIVEDVNGDGIQDLIVSHPVADSISFWEGKLSENQFSLANTSVEIQVGEFPTSLAAGQFRGTGSFGIAIANRSSDNVFLIYDILNQQSTILDGNHGVEKDPLQLVTGDWNNDGCLDLAILSGNKERVNIFKNTSCSNVSENSAPQEFTFEKIGNSDVGEDPQGMIAGDWDHDGLMDLAISNRIDDDITLLYGEGEGIFVRWDVRVGDGPGQLASADFNGDGVEDFVVGNLIDQDLTVLLSNGDGSRPGTNNQRAYSRAHIASGSIPAGNRPAFIKIIDVNGDDRLDILLTLPFEDKISLLLQE